MDSCRFMLIVARFRNLRLFRLFARSWLAHLIRLFSCFIWFFVDCIGLDYFYATFDAFSKSLTHKI